MTIPLSKLKSERVKDRYFCAAYERLKPEFVIAPALIKTREKAAMSGTQRQVKRSRRKKPQQLTCRQNPGASHQKGAMWKV